jgi:hypothetical protein
MVGSRVNPFPLRQRTNRRRGQSCRRCGLSRGRNGRHLRRIRTDPRRPVRKNGRCQAAYLQVGDDGNFGVVPNDQINLQALLSTDARRKAWEQLPDAFTYDEAEQLVVPAAMRSKSSFYDFFSHGQRLGLILDSGEGKWQKLTPTDTTEPGEVTEVTEVAKEFQHR